MSTAQIRSAIQHAIKDEERTSRLASTILTVARNNGANLTEQQVLGVVDFVKVYVQQVPDYLEHGIAAARQLGLVYEMNQMVSELLSYWLLEDDLLPDHLGLVGIMDDAYASMLLLQSLSDYCKATVGRPLLAHDLTLANRLVRQLIGEPAVSILDQRVALTLSQALMNQLVGLLVTQGLTMGPDPASVVEDARLDHQATVALSSMGYVP